MYFIRTVTVMTFVSILGDKGEEGKVSGGKIWEQRLSIKHHLKQ